MRIFDWLKSAKKDIKREIAPDETYIVGRITVKVINGYPYLNLDVPEGPYKGSTISTSMANAKMFVPPTATK